MISVAEPNHFSSAPAPGKTNSAPTGSGSKQQILIKTFEKYKFYYKKSFSKPRFCPKNRQNLQKIDLISLKFFSLFYAYIIYILI